MGTARSSAEVRGGLSEEVTRELMKRSRSGQDLEGNTAGRGTDNGNGNAGVSCTRLCCEAGEAGSDRGYREAWFNRWAGTSTCKAFEDFYMVTVIVILRINNQNHKIYFILTALHRHWWILSRGVT